MEVAILLISAILGISLFIIKKYVPSFKVGLVIKILAVMYFIVGFVRLFLPDDFLLVINGAYDYSRYFDTTDIYSSILRWGYQTSLLIIPVLPFFKNNIHLRRIVVFYCLPFLILNIIHFNNYMDYFLSKEILAVRFHDPFNFGKLPDWFRYMQFIAELVLATTISIYFSISKAIYKFKLKEVGIFILILIPLIFLSVPVYVPQSLFGYGNLMLTGFTLQNYIWIIFMVIVIFVIYFLFRFQSYENRYLISIILSLFLLIFYNSFYLTGVTIPRLPIQLCNLACYLLIIAVLFKWQKLFDFIIIANILGTLIAIFVPDLDTGIFSFFHFHFLYEHMMIFITPIIILSLRIFEKPNIKSLRNAIVGFTIYFAFCWSTGTYLNSISDETGYTVNYFYIFKDDVVSVFTFLSFSRKIAWKVGGVYTIYPIYQLLIYIMFCLGCFALFKVIKWFEKIADNHFQLRIIRIKENEEKKGHISEKAIRYEEEVK